MKDLSELHAPYNFVPLSKDVIRNWGAELPSQDLPYRDGLCGELELILTAETPLLIGGEQKDREKRFARDAQGRPEIPGSSLRGMIRNLVEIASFSAIAPFVEDRSFGLRDLSGPSAESYRRKFQRYGQVQQGSDREVKVSRGGWLFHEKGEWKIEPCQVRRVRYEEIFQIAPQFQRPFQMLREDNKIDRKQAPQIYGLWRQARGGLDDQALAHDGGLLVFTGNPSYNRNNPRPNKKGEFLFSPSREPALPVPDAVWRGFLDVHEDQEKESATWMWWKKRLGLEAWDREADKALPRDPAARIPVFYLADGDEVLTLGLAQMFKMHGRSTHQSLDRTHAEHMSGLNSAAPERLDLAERIFGRIGGEAGASFKGRVSFGAGRIAPDSGAWREQEHETVGAAPKAGFFPAYLRQQAARKKTDRNGNEVWDRKYVTWSDDDAEIKGWKRYPAQIRAEGYAPPPPPPNSGEASRARLRPIVAERQAAPLVFRSMMRFHNLRPFELGALIWALSWGGDEEARHALGMGKPWGWGRVKIALKGFAARPNDPAAPEASAPEIFRADFAAAMEKRVKGWANSPQIRSLLAMARPADAQAKGLTYMQLEVGGPQGNVNEFQKARNLAAILPDYGIPTIWSGGGSGASPATGGAAPSGGGQRAAPPSALFRRGEAVADEGGDGVVTRDQKPSEDQVWVSFEGAPEEAVPAKALRRRR